MAAKKSVSVADIDAFLADMVAKRGGSLDALAGYRGMMVGAQEQGYMSTDWAKKQTYIALGQLMTVCAALNLDACPMEGFLPEKYDEILKIGPDYTASVLCPVGYRSSADNHAAWTKVRYGADKLIQHL
jgi:nitroreductase